MIYDQVTREQTGWDYLVVTARRNTTIYDQVTRGTDRLVLLSNHG